jgi:hypothetical protein
VITNSRLRIALVGSALAAVTFAFGGAWAWALSGDRGVVQDASAWIALAIFIAIYRTGYVEVRRAGPDALAVVLAIGAVMAAVGVSLKPESRQDVFAYVNFGWMQYHYHLNPYAHLMNQAPGWKTDPMVTRWWATVPMPYGFGFAALARALCALGGGSLGATVLLFKIVNVAAAGAIAAMLMAIARRSGAIRAEVAAYLFLWNPFLALQFFTNAHNDILIALSAVAAIYFAAAGLWIAIIPALALGFLVKYIPAILIPFAITVVVRRKGWSTALWGCAIAAAICAAFSIPYLRDRSAAQAIFTIRKEFDSFDSLPAALGMVTGHVASLAGIHLRGNQVAFFYFAAGVLGAALLYAIQVVGFARMRSPSPVDLAAVCLFVEFVVLCVARNKFSPWYVGSFFPLAMILPARSWLLQLTIALSFAGLIGFTRYTVGLPLAGYILMLAAPTIWIVVRNWGAVHRALAGHWDESGGREQSTRA